MKKLRLLLITPSFALPVVALLQNRSADFLLHIRIFINAVNAENGHI